MKYLVNRETKEHIRVYDLLAYHCNPKSWNVVEADDEGWIEWRGKSQECPLPDDAKVAALFSYDNNPCGKLPAKDWRWSDKTLTHYRPILPVESEPEPSTKIKRFATVTNGGSAFIADFDTRHASANVFDRLSAAVSASESIPALIAEINAMLPEGYEVREKAKVKSVMPNPDALYDFGQKAEQTAEDMSDWMNWREGDLMEVIDVDDDDEKAGIKVGDKATIEQGCNAVPYCTIGEKARYPLLSSQLRFHSRPVTK